MLKLSFPFTALPRQVAKIVSQQKVILKMISDQLQLSAPSPVAPDANQLVKLTVCFPLAMPLFSPFATSLPYVAYLVNSFLPNTNLEVPQLSPRKTIYNVIIY